MTEKISKAEAQEVQECIDLMKQIIGLNILNQNQLSIYLGIQAGSISRYVRENDPIKPRLATARILFEKMQDLVGRDKEKAGTRVTISEGTIKDVSVQHPAERKVLFDLADKLLPLKKILEEKSMQRDILNQEIAVTQEEVDLIEGTISQLRSIYEKANNRK